MLAELLGQKDKADALYKMELKTAGPSPRVVDAYGRFLERNGRAKDAQALYAKVADDSAFAPVVQAGLARIAAGQTPDPLIQHAEDGAAEALFGIAASLGDEASRDISILYLRLALYLQPNLDLAKLLLADRFEALEKYDNAIEVYRTVGTGFSLLPRRRGGDRGRRGALEQARRSHREPEDVDYELSRRRRNLDRAGRHLSPSEEISRRDQSLRSGNPGGGHAGARRTGRSIYARAIAEQQSNDWNAAETDLKLALKLSPDEPQVLNYLGYSWVDQHRKSRRRWRCWRRPARLSPDDGYIVDSVGWAYYRLGRYADAAKTLERAVQMVPGDPTINDHLGDAYWKVGRKLDARFQWNHALAFGADAGEKTKIEKKLEVGLTGGKRS